MAATIQIHEMSALDAGVDKTSGTVRFKSANDATVNTANPIPMPSSGQTSLSFTKRLRPYMQAAPDVEISDLKWYSDGSNGMGTGITVQAKNIGVTWGAGNYQTAMSGGANLFSYTSAFPLDGDGADAGPFVPADLNDYIGDMIELQLAVADTATHGQSNSESLTLAYSEI